MGLDMYAKKRKERISESVDFEHKKGDEDLFYWRKHPNLHGWMEALYREKGGKERIFNCTTLQLTTEDIDQLGRDIEENKLPETVGFFFGKTTPDRIEEDREFIKLARKTLSEGNSIYYSSWW